MIVNDASTDDSLEQATAFKEIHAHPVRIVDKRLNTGLADARNIGAELAPRSMLSSWTQTTWFFLARSSSCTQDC